MYLIVFVQEQFVSGGEMNSNYTKVGVAFPLDKGDGFNLKITPGLSVSGDLVVFPPRENEDG